MSMLDRVRFARPYANRPYRVDRQAREDRIAWMRRWEADKVIAITAAPLAPEQPDTCAMVWIGGVAHKEALDVFPTEAMIAKVLFFVEFGRDK